jgi:gliding motility-associated-like protein
VIKDLITYCLLFLTLSASAQHFNLLPDTMQLCVGDSAHVEIKSQLDNNAIISWNTPYGIITNTKRLQASKAGKYYVKVNLPNSGSTMYDSCYVRFSSKVKHVLRDTFFCKGKSLVLDARYTGLNFLWSTGETSQKIKIESAGRYWVKIKNGNCTTTDSVKVKVISNAAVYIAPETTFCLNDDHKVLTVKAANGSRFLWNTGATTPTIAVNHDGIYWVRTETGNCGSQLDSVKVKMKICECEMIIPNSFTPNEDNRNDYFFPVVQCEYSYYNITITDRWGNNVYTSNNVNGKWDGRFKGNLCPEDIYIYRIESTEKGGDKKQVRNGRISLFR